MNQKTNIELAAEMSPRTRIVSYAPVASTHGDKVKIYRYGFERIGTEYRQQLEAEQHSMRKAIIRYEWARFILNHLDEYSGNKEIFRRSANVLATTAFLEAKQLLSEAERNYRKAYDRVRRAERRAGIIRNADNEGNTKGLTAAEKSELATLRYDLKLCRKRQNELSSICPDSIFERIRHLAENSK